MPETNRAAIHFEELNLTDYEQRYDTDIIKYLVHATPRVNVYLRYVFASNTRQDFLQEWQQLVILHHRLEVPVLFVTLEPGSMATGHFIVGVLHERQLLLINPLGITRYQDYELLQKLQQAGDVEKLRLSNTLLQRDSDGTVSYGPLCVELVRWISELPPNTLFTHEGTSVERHQMSFTSVDMTNLLENSLLSGCLTVPLNAYRPLIESFRAAHYQTLIALTDKQAESALNSDEQVIMNRLVVQKQSLFALESMAEYQRLQQQISVVKLPNRSSESVPKLNSDNNNNVSLLRAEPSMVLTKRTSRPQLTQAQPISSKLVSEMEDQAVSITSMQFLNKVSVASIPTQPISINEQEHLPDPILVQHLHRGDELLAVNEKAATEEYVNILKLAYQKQTYNPEYQLLGYQKLGDVYLQREDYINAIALYNFALAISQDKTKITQFKQPGYIYRNELIEKIKNAEKLFLHSITGSNALSPEDYKLDVAHQTYLKGIRNHARARLNWYEALTTAMVDALFPDNDSNKANEIARLQQNGLTIQNIYLDINEKLRNFISILIVECMKLLGTPPCGYAFICFGSLARDEATPYSDLEFGILIEDMAERYRQLGILYYVDEDGYYPFIQEGEVINEKNKHYFRNLTKLLNIKIINLGETTPRMQDIKELTEAGLAGRYSESPNKPGLSFDGNNRDGRKTPLGNMHFKDVADGNKYELIATPKEMAQLHNDKWYKKDKHLSTALMTVKLIVGSQALCDAYEREMEVILSKEDHTQDRDLMSSKENELGFKTIIQKRSLELLQESLENYQFRGGRFEKEGHFFDAKYHLYRQPNMLIDHLATYFGVKERNLWDRVRALFGPTGKVPSQSSVVNLLKVASTILQLRLASYLRSDYRDNHIVPFDTKNPQKNETLLTEHLAIGQDLLSQIYATLIQMQWVIENFLNQKYSTSVFTTLDTSYYQDSYFVRGKIYALLLDYDRALEAYRESDRIIKEAHGINHPAIIDIKTQLGHIYHEQGHYEEALKAYKEAQQIAYQIYEAENNIIAETYGNIGIIYTEQGNYVDAFKSYKEAQRIFKKLYEVNHLAMAKMWAGLANIYSLQESYYEALNALDEAKRILALTLPTDHIYFYNIWTCLGNIYQKQARFDDALDAHKQAQKICKTVYGVEHITTAQTWDNLVITYADIGNYQEGLKAYDEAKRIKTAIYSAEHISMVTTWTNLGLLYEKQGDYGKALKACKEALRIYQVVKSTRQSVEADIWKNLGRIYYVLKCYDKARNACKEALKVYQKFPPANNRFIAETLSSLALTYVLQACYMEALEAYKRVKEIFIHARNKEETAKYAVDIGNLYVQLGCYHEAIEAYMEAQQLFQTMQHSSPLPLAIIYNNVGLVYVEMRQFEQARTHYEQAIQIYKSLEHPDVRRAMRNLETSYIREGNTYMLKDDKDVQAAETHYQRINPSWNPSNPDLQQKLADECYRLNQLPAALEHFKILIKLEPNSATYQNAGALTHARAQLERNKNNETDYLAYLKEADEYFQQAIQLDPNAGAYTEYAQFLLKNRMHDALDKAIEYLQKAIQLNQLDKGLSYGVMERSTLDSHLQHMIDRYNEIVFIAHHLAYYLLVQAYLANGQLSAAEDALKNFGKAIAQFQQSQEKECEGLLQQANLFMQAHPDPEQAVLIQQEVLQMQQASDKVQRVIEELMTIARQAVASYEIVHLQPTNDNENDCDPELEEAIKLSLMKSDTSQTSELSTTEKTSKVSESFKGALVTSAGDAHNELMKKLKTIVGNDDKDFQSFFNAIEARAYSKALRELCKSKREEVLKLASTLLEYEKILSININEQVEDNRFTAIHYTAINRSQALYDFLVERGANEELLYDNNVTVKEYMQQRQRQNILD